MQLAQLVGYLDEYLRVRDIPDSAEALNGLQVGGRSEVTRVAVGVDPCLEAVGGPAAAGAHLLNVPPGVVRGGLLTPRRPPPRGVPGRLLHDNAPYETDL